MDFSPTYAKPAHIPAATYNPQIMNDTYLSVDKYGYVYKLVDCAKMKMIPLGICLDGATIKKFHFYGNSFAILTSNQKLYIAYNLDKLYSEKNYNKCTSCDLVFLDHIYCKKCDSCYYCCGHTINTDIINADIIDPNVIDNDHVYAPLDYQPSYNDYVCYQVSPNVSDILIYGGVLFYIIDGDIYFCLLYAPKFYSDITATKIESADKRDAHYRFSLDPIYTKIKIENNYIRLESDTHTALLCNQIEKKSYPKFLIWNLGDIIPGDIDFRLGFGSENYVYKKSVCPKTHNIIYKNINPNIESFIIPHDIINKNIYITCTIIDNLANVCLCYYYVGSMTNKYYLKSFNIISGCDPKNIPKISDVNILGESIFVLTDSDLKFDDRVYVIDSRKATHIYNDHYTSFAYIIDYTIHIYSVYNPIIFKKNPKCVDKFYDLRIELPNHIPVEKISCISPCAYSVGILCTDNTVHILSNYNRWDKIKIMYTYYNEKMYADMNDIKSVVINGYKSLPRHTIHIDNIPDLKESSQIVSMFNRFAKKRITYVLCDNLEEITSGRGNDRYILTKASDEFNARYLAIDSGTVTYNSATISTLNPVELIAVGQLLRTVCHYNKSLQYSLPVSLLAAIIGVKKIDDFQYNLYKLRTMDPIEARHSYQSRFTNNHTAVNITDIDKNIAHGFNMSEKITNMTLAELDISIRGFIKIDRKNFISNIKFDNTTLESELTKIINSIDEEELMIMIRNWSGNYNFEKNFNAHTSIYTPGISYATCFRKLTINAELLGNDLLKTLLVSPIDYVVDKKYY